MERVNYIIQQKFNGLATKLCRTTKITEDYNVK